MLHCVKLSVAWKSDEKALYTVKAQNLDHQLVIMDDRLKNSNYQTQIMLPHITVYHYWTTFKGSFLEGGGGGWREKSTVLRSPFTKQQGFLSNSPKPFCKFGFFKLVLYFILLLRV